MNSGKRIDAREVLSRPLGYSAGKPNVLRAMPNWNTPRDCAQCAISVRAKSSPQDRWFTAFASGWRRAVSRAWNAGLLRFLKNNPLLRLSIHPPDYSHPAIWRQIVRSDR